MVMCENVKVPWERVFVHMDAILSRDIYIKTPSHCFGNHQSNVRFYAKMRLVLGLCSKIAHSSGAIEVPAVKRGARPHVRARGRIAGMVAGQIDAFERLAGGLHVLQPPHDVRRAQVVHRELLDRSSTSCASCCGGGVFQMPADISVMEDRAPGRQFEHLLADAAGRRGGAHEALQARLGPVGSEFAGRHLQYEKFYAGASFIVRNHAFRETPWNEFHGIVDGLMSTYDVPRT